MKIRTLGLLVLLLTLTVWLTGCASQQTAGEETGARNDVLFVCDCGPECKCDSVSTQPGNCKCDKPMKWHHVLKVEGNEALLCTCNEGCKCALDPNDPTKCGCGNPVKRVDLAGTGVYFCNCGGSCTCNVASSEPGVCGCGMQLKKVD